MRLLMVNNEFPPVGGGTGTVNLALLERFDRIPDLAVDLITSTMGKRFEVEMFSTGIQVYKLPVFKRNIHHASNVELLTFAIKALRFALKKHRQQPYDLCFAWSAVPSGGVALGLRRMTGLNYLVRVSGPDIPGFEKRYQWLYPLLGPIIRSVWHGAEVVITKCEEESAMIRAIDNKINVVIVPNGVDQDLFKPVEKRLDNRPLRVLCVARLIERKGQSHLIKALKHLADEHVDVLLELVGTGDQGDNYRSLVRNLGIGDRVTFSGYVPREEIAKHYAASDIFVLPSFNEGMSVATLEAMAAGLPLVVTRTGGATDLVEDGVNGYIYEWADEVMLIELLRRLAQNRNLVRRMGAASRRRSARFAWEKSSRSYMNLIAELGQKRPKSKSFLNEVEG
jgi:phosphatidylinositol alpha-1,6-mannosyltransferase